MAVKFTLHLEPSGSPHRRPLFVRHCQKFEHFRFQAFRIPRPEEEEKQDKAGDKAGKAKDPLAKSPVKGAFLDKIKFEEIPAATAAP